MPQRSIRFSDKVVEELKAVSCKRGFASATAFIRYAVEQELSARQEGLTGAEERLAASVEQVRKEVFRLARAQQAHHLLEGLGAKADGDGKLRHGDLTPPAPLPVAGRGEKGWKCDMVIHS